MTELSKLKKRIKSKFRSINSFCRASGEDSYELQKLFSCESANPGKSTERTKRLEDLGELCRKTDPSADTNKLTSEIRAKISNEIMNRGGVLQFCRDNEQFISASVFQIIDGRRKNVTNKVIELVDFLGIKE